VRGAAGRRLANVQTCSRCVVHVAVPFIAGVSVVGLTMHDGVCNSLTRDTDLRDIEYETISHGNRGCCAAAGPGAARF
jgi:hypothetical protein